MARAAVDSAFALRPDLPQAYTTLGQYYYQGHKDFARALEALAIAETSMPSDELIRELTAYIFRRRGQFEKAVTNFERAFEYIVDDQLGSDLAQTL